MKDLKKIQEFFSKPLKEGKQLDNTDFTKVVKAVEQTGHPVTVLLVPKFNEIEVLTGTDAPDDMIRDLSIAVDSLGYGRNDIIIAGDSSNLSRREYSDIFRVNGGHQDYFNESVNEAKNLKKAKQALIDFNSGKLGEDEMVKTVIKSLGFKFDDYSEEEAGVVLSSLIKKGKIPTDNYVLNNVIDVLEESVNENTFKKGDKVTYLGHPAVVTATKEYNGRDFVSVSYDKGTGKTSASMILATSGDVKAVNEMDINDPILMKMRAAKMKADKFAGSDPKAGSTIKGRGFDWDKNTIKIDKLKKKRAQIMSDMEQEAEPEGGPIADEYGSELNRIDAAIAKLSGRKEMTYDQAIAEGKGKMPTQDQVDRFFELTQNETHYLNSKPVAGQEKTFNKMEVEPWDEYDLSNWNSLVRKAKAKGKSLDEVKVDYDFSERELIRVLRQLKRGASTEIDMIKAFTKALGRDITKDELFSESIDEDNSYARVSKPRFIKDKRNPNFLNVYIDYDLGPGGSSIALGKETMTGQIRRLSAAKAMKVAGNIARDLEAKYNLEDIDIQDLENGKVQIFAVSDDFIDMDVSMLGENKILKQSKLSSSEYQKAKKLKDFNKDDYEWNSVEGLYVKEKKSKFKKHGEMEGFDLRGLKESIARNLAKKLKKQINEEVEDNGAEEKSFDAELMAAANGIAATLGKELKAKQGDKEQLDEAVVTSIIAAVLTGNALIGFISKMSKKLAKKLNWKKGEDFADKINKWAHDNEKAFQKPIKRVLKFFIKDETKLEATTKAIYAVVIMGMAAGYGVEAVSSLSNASWFQASVASLKTIAKGDEAIATAYPVIKSFVA